MDIDNTREKMVCAYAIATTIGFYHDKHFQKNPKRVSLLTGNGYTAEILSSTNSDRTNRILRMRKESFMKLSAKLKANGCLKDSRKGISVERQLMQFLHIVAG